MRMRVLYSEEDVRGKVEEVGSEDWTIIYPILLVVIVIAGTLLLNYLY